MISPKTKRYLFKIIPFAAIWLLFGLSYTLLEKGLLGDLDYYPSTGNPYDFGGSTLLFLLLLAVFGLIIGHFEITYLSKLFGKQSVSKKILYKSLIYLSIIIFFLILSTILSNSYGLGANASFEAIWQNFWTFITSFAFLSVVLFIALIITVSLFFSEVSENIGIQVLHNFFVGKYHQPIQEDRIFMFVDMKSSTTIAEQLGHVKYFQMLKEYYADFSESIISYSGEIYQYVGDEIIITWPLGSGLANNNSINCFFSMQDAITNKSDKYQSKYGLVPTFKAGLHEGKVTTGEIGEIKKDIIFTGDVLNTTARIQGLCNDYQVNILLSDNLKAHLVETAAYELLPLGQSELRGRAEHVELYTVNRLRL
jgi:adenylate cyclase